MKKIIAFVMAGFIVLSGSLCFASAQPESNNTCVMLKFSDDTRFDSIDTAGTLSDLVLERLISSGKFRFKETKVIDKDMEQELYAERLEEFRNAKVAFEQGNYSTLFEGPGYEDDAAQSISSADKGQIVSPSVTKAIGEENGAEYIIQGTITDIGRGGNISWDTMAMYGQMPMEYSILMAFIPKKIGISIMADVRVIRSETGEVVWCNTFVGNDTQSYHDLGIAKFGSDKMNNEMYYKAVNATAKNIADSMLADLAAGNLFGNK